MQKAMFIIHNLDDDQLIKWAISLTNLNMQSLSIPFLSLRKTRCLTELPRCLLDSHWDSETINTSRKIVYERSVPAGHSDTPTFNFLKL